MMLVISSLIWLMFDESAEAKSSWNGSSSSLSSWSRASHSATERSGTLNLMLEAPADDEGDEKKFDIPFLTRGG